MEPAESEGAPQVDDRGEFRIYGLAPGRDYLLAEPDRYWESERQPYGKDQEDGNNRPSTSRQPTWYPASSSAESAAPITLTAGQHLDGVEIRLRRGAGSKLRIRGQLAGIQDLPAPPSEPEWIGRQISALGESHGYSGKIQTDGSFEIADVASGAYEIWVLQGFGGLTVLGHATVQLGDRDLENVSIDLHPPQTLTVTVRTEDAAGAELPPSTIGPRITVGLEPVDRPGIDSIPVPNNGGSFAFNSMGLGRYRVTVQEAVRRQAYLKLIRYGNAESLDGTFTLSSYGVPLELVFSTRGARLSGTVTGASATPQVVLIRDTPDAARREYDTRAGVFDQSGAFTIDSIPPGAYKLYAFENVPEEIWLDPGFLKEVEGSGVAFEAAEGDVKSLQVPLLVKALTDRVLAKLGIE